MTVNLNLKLEIQSGPYQGKRFSFPATKTVRIGRSGRADICIPEDSRIAELHVQLNMSAKGCQFQTLAGHPSILLQGRPVRSGTLDDGDVLQVGDTQFKYIEAGFDQPRDICDPNAPTQLTPEDVLRNQNSEYRKLVASPVESMNAFPIQFPGFSVTRQIGQGGMGVVYEARSHADGEKVAIKVMTARQIGERDMQLFLREASVLSSLIHPRIVRFREIGWVEGKTFIAMEYVDSIDTKKLMASVPLANRVRLASGIIAQVLSALDYAHRRNIVHRDVKPANILVARVQRKLQSKLSDFGIAKAFDRAGFSAMTADGETRGTLAYMAPEQLENSRYAKPPADIYSVGVTLFYYLTGKLPFRFPCSKPKKLMDDVTATPENIDGCLQGVPAELCQLITRAMAIQPANRFSTAAEMRDALVPFAKSSHN